MKKQSNQGPPTETNRPKPPPRPPSPPPKRVVREDVRWPRISTGQHRASGHSECGPDKYKAWVRVTCKSVRLCKHNDKGNCNLKWITVDTYGQCGMYEVYRSATDSHIDAPPGPSEECEPVHVPVSNEQRSGGISVIKRFIGNRLKFLR